MKPFRPFEMERWQSTYEYRVDFNLSESGVHPLTVRELLDLAGTDTADDTLLGYGQSNGSDELRATIARLYPGASEAGVVVCNGSAEANFAAMWRLVSPGDEVVVIVPTYAQTIGLAQMLGGTVKTVPLREEAGWQPDPDAIRAAVTERTRVIVVTNPNNPTGALLSDEARAAVVAAAERTGAWIMADEVYIGAELSGRETPSFFGSTERVVGTGSLSKAYGLPGLRVGWTVSSADMREDLWARTDYTTIAPGTLTDRLADLALSPTVRPKLLARTRERIQTGLEVLEAWMGDVGVFHYRRPEAGAICYAKYDLPVNSSELAERLRAEHSVLVVPGDQFGMDGYVRFGIGNPPHELREGLQRVGEAVQSIRAAGAAAR